MKFITLLIEGKKERIIDKFRGQLEPLGDEAIQHVEKIIDQDPSATKKYSEWAIKKFITIGGKFSLQHTTDEINKVVKNYHSIVDRLSKEKVEKIIDGDDSNNAFNSEDSKNKVLKSPKDINSFETLYELQKFLTLYDKFQFLSDQEEKSKKESEKLYEDDRFLIIRPLSHTSSCYYGANTKWCTTTRDNEDYFSRYTSKGKLYYIIDKKSSDKTYGKMALLIPFGNGTPEVYNQQDGGERYAFLLERFAPIKDEIQKLTKKGDDYETLKKVKGNPKISMYESLNSDFFDRFDGENVILNFSDELTNFLKLMEEEVGEDVIGHYDWAYTNPHGDFFYETYRFDDDMREGYPLYNLNEEHIGLLRSIVEIIEPELLKYFDGNTIIRDGNGDEILAKFIKEGLPKIYEEFSYLYSQAEDTSIHEGIKKYVDENVCNLYDDVGLTKVEDGSCFGQYEISVDRLLEMYEDDLEYNKDLSIQQVLENYIHRNVDLNEDILELYHEYQDHDTFSEMFDNEMTNLLEKVLEEIESDDEVVSDAREYRRILNYITKNFGLDKPYPIKTSDDGTEIIFRGVDPKNSKIEFVLVNGVERKTGSAKLSTIIKLLNNYTLFSPF
jgi:hypothetical protein